MVPMVMQFGPGGCGGLIGVREADTVRFTERELTVALEGAAKSMLAAQDKTVRKGRRTADEAWDSLTKYQRFQLLDGLGDQLLSVLVALPDVEVEVGTRPTFTDAQIRVAVEERLGDLRALKRKVVLEARVALVKVALESVPPRQDPDALIVPDHI
jgi:hypothetical protein